MKEKINPQKFKEMAELEQTIKAHQSMYENASRQLQQLQETIRSLKGFKELKGDEEILLPLANGIMASAKLKGNKLFMNVGASIIKEKSVDEAITELVEQEAEIMQFLAKIEEEFNKLATRVDDYKNVR